MPSTNGHGSNGATERVALLMRVSSEEQRERETIEIQRQFLDEYCRLYELDVVAVYEDDGTSGTIPLHERPEGKRLLGDARVGKFQTVLVKKLDRLVRTLLVIVDAHDRLQQAGVSLRSATEPIDTSTPSGRLIFQMLASFAEYDRENIAERTRGGLRRAWSRGKHMGTIPYGYDITEDGSFVVVPEEAKIVRETFEPIRPTHRTNPERLFARCSALHVERYYEKDGYCARIMSFVVGPEHRGRGVGRALISAAEDWARQRGARDNMLTTHKRSSDAHRFYRSVGYEATGYRFFKEL
jgi:DNA invertase Pin-like site-specific DNA recombinase